MQSTALYVYILLFVSDKNPFMNEKAARSFLKVIPLRLKHQNNA